ncbi:fimbria/pilus outer membrane usher protein [Hyphomonas beringensis]|nr:fimbria/pilus outer membrane usher protein [Hyphomonas beringensis]
MLRTFLACSTMLAGMHLYKPKASAEQEPEPAPPAAAPKVNKDASIDEIYGALFGKAPTQAISLPYPVIISGINQGDVMITPSMTQGETLIDRKAIVDLLLPFLIEEKQAELLETVSQEDKVKSGDLTSLGMPTRFDNSNLILVIDIPVEFRSVIPLPIQPRIRAALQLDTEDQAKTSAIVNMAAGTRYIHSSKYLETGFAATQVNLQTAFNIFDVVLETGLRYSDASDEELALNDTRLTKDLVVQRTRLEAGDLSVPTSALQGNPSLLGIAGFRNFGLQPYEEYRTNPSQQFELQRAAQVMVYINGQFIREIRLLPGRYNLTDLPLQSAAGNDITLEIQYDSGDTDRVVFSAFYDFSLLKKGLTDFAVSVGPTSRIEDGVREYDFDNPAISAFYRKGWTDEFTAGVNLQADTELLNLGGDAFYTSGVGTFGFLAGLSETDEGTGSAITGLYRWNDTDRGRQLRFDLQARYQSDLYTSLGSGTSNIKYDLTARVSRNFSDTMRVQLTTGFRQRHDMDEFEQSHSANLTWRTRYGTLGSLVRYTTAPGEEAELSAGISFSMRLGSGYAQASHDTRSSSTRASYSSRMDRNVGSLGWDAAYSRQSNIDDIRAGASYIGNRFESRIEQRLTAATQFDGFGSENFTEASIGSALVYADGAFALSRPVYDSFVIFSKNDAVKDVAIAVDPRRNIFEMKPSYAAHSSSLGPAVVPDLNAYYVRTIEVEAPGAPAGTSLGGQALSFLPGYRSGYVVKLGDDRNVAVMSLLVDTEGKPVPFAAGYAITSDGERHQMFTNRGGRFYIDGLKHGETVELQFDSPEGATASFEVPDGDIGVIRMPDPVRIAPEKPEAPYQVTVRVMKPNGA